MLAEGGGMEIRIGNTLLCVRGRGVNDANDASIFWGINRWGKRGL